MTFEGDISIRREIVDVTFDLIEELGFENVSLTAVAAAARVSLGTVKKCYRDRLGLFTALVQANTAHVTAAVQTTGEKFPDAMTALEEVGTELLFMVLGKRAVMLRRASVIDGSGELGRIILENGPEEVNRVIDALMLRAIGEREVAGEPRDLTETYLALILGNMQVFRMSGTMPSPDRWTCAARAVTAVERLVLIHPPIHRAPSMGFGPS